MPADFRHRASYLYLLRLSPTEIEAEFRRRKNVTAGCRERVPGGRPGKRLLSGGQRDVERHTADIKVIKVDAGVHPHSYAFDLWRIDGYRALEHQGDRLHLMVDAGHVNTKIHLPAELGQGDRLAFLLPIGINFAPAVSVAAQANKTLTGKATTLGKAWRPPPRQLLLIRALIALDAHLAGASYRKTAEAVFGPQTVRARWRGDATLKEQTRYLVRKAHMLMNQTLPSREIGA